MPSAAPKLTVTESTLIYARLKAANCETATLKQRNEAIASVLAAIFLAVAAFIDLRIAAAIAAVYLIVLTTSRMLSKRRKQ
jgi:hypothetical protein